jgi:hypothetical protein
MPDIRGYQKRGEEKNSSSKKGLREGRLLRKTWRGVARGRCRARVGAFVVVWVLAHFCAAEKMVGVVVVAVRAFGR